MFSKWCSLKRSPNNSLVKNWLHEEWASGSAKKINIKAFQIVYTFWLLKTLNQTLIYIGIKKNSFSDLGLYFFNN